MTPKTETKTRVRDVMSRNPICVTGAADARELARLFDENDVSGVPVVDAQDRVVGVVSRTDLLHRCVEGPPGSRPGGAFLEALGESASLGGFDPEELGLVQDFMTDPPVTATPDETVKAVARRMAEERVHRIVVIDERGHAVGIVTTLDIMSVFPG